MQQNPSIDSRPDEPGKSTRNDSVADDARKRVIVSALRKLLAETSLEKQLQFLHGIKVRFTLSTTDKGLYVCRVFKQTKIDGHVMTLNEYQRGGKSPHTALLNAIADFLMREDGDYHDFMYDDWAGKRNQEWTDDWRA